MTSWVVLATIVGYFILLFFVSYMAGRKSDNASFFTGNRQTPWYIVAFATMGAAISGVTFISVPGMVVGKSFSYLQMCIGFIVGYFAVAYILVPIFYKRNLISIYGYLEQRFGAMTYKSGAWFFFVSKMLGAAVRFYVVCVVLQSLAARYAKGIKHFDALLPEPIKKINIIGGGSQNKLLNRLTSEATGLPVIAGPVEATGIGNILVQAIALGEINRKEDVKY